MALVELRGRGRTGGKGGAHQIKDPFRFLCRGPARRASFKMLPERVRGRVT